MLRNWFIGAALTALLTSPVMAANGGTWGSVAEEVCAEITHAEDAAKLGHWDEAKAKIISAYFGIFEEKKMEIAERLNLGTSHTADIEDMFNTLRKASSKQDSNFAATAEKLRKALRNDAKTLDVAKIGPDGMEGSK